MLKNIYACDLCKKEITKGVSILFKHGERSNSFPVLKTSNNLRHGYSYSHICPNCISLVTNNISVWSKDI